MNPQVKQHDCRKELREVELKATPARLAVLKVLESADRPLDVATIKSNLEKHGIDANPATVFRMMNSFSDKGLVREVNLQESKQRYEHASKADHHHLLCENCKAIEDISDCNIENWEKELKDKRGFLIRHHSIEFFGLCKDCQN
jgi:Fur family transcriptional regulator, ferric uptake regulator